MRVVQLSSHPGDMLGDAARRRQAAEQHVLSVYEDELVRHRARVQSTQVKRDRARAGRHWWAWLRLSAATGREKRRVPRPPVPAAGHAPYGRPGRTDREATELGRRLDDTWTLLRGYRNRCGEINHLLLGPRGLFAIELGRSPSFQLDEAAGELERFLAGHGHPAPVQRAAGGPRAVEVQRAVGCVLDLVEASAGRLDREQRAAIADLIQRDRAVQAERRR